MPLPEVLKLVIDGGALVLLAVIVVYTGPALLREGRAEREKQAVEYARLIDGQRAAFEARTLSLVQAIEAQTASLVKALEANAREVRAALSRMERGRPGT